MKRPNVQRLAVPLAISALILASCGGDDSSSSAQIEQVSAAAEEASDMRATSDETAEETSSGDVDARSMMLSSFDSNPLTEGDITESEAECIIDTIAAEEPELFDAMFASEMRALPDLDAEDALLVLKISADCTRDSVVALMQSENPGLDINQAECLFDEVYGPDSVTMGFVALVAEMELQGASEEDPEFVEAATEMMMVLMGEPSRIADICGIDEGVVSTVLENSGADGVDTEDDMDNVDPYLDDGMDLGEIDTDNLDADVSPEQIMCMMDELQAHPELLETLLATGEVNTDNPADLMILLEAGMACGISGF